MALTLNLSKADSFTIEPVEATPEAVHFKILVKEGEHVVAEQSGVIHVSGAPAPPSGTGGTTQAR